jgi:hypothetical protein
LILASPIDLYGKKLGIKQAFYHCLELGELLKDFRFETQEINLSEFTKIINETNIILLSSKGIMSWPQYIRENKLKRFRRNASGQGTEVCDSLLVDKNHRHVDSLIY